MAAVGPVKGGPAAGSKAGVVGRVHRTYTGPRRAKVVLGGTQAVRSRAPARRQAGRPRLAQQIGTPQPKRIKLGQGGHVWTPEAQGPVEGAFVAAAERLKAKAWGRAGPVASPPPPLCKGPDRGGRVQEQPPLFLEFMQALTPYFHWIAERERCGLWMVAKRVDLWLNRVFDTAEDFRLQGALPALLGALRKLHPDAWEACLHINTSPISRFMGGVEDAILDRGLGPIGSHQLPHDLWDAVVPPLYRGGLQDFDVEREWQDGDRAVRGATRWVLQQVQRIVQALRGAGVYEETADPPPPRVTPSSSQNPPRRSP